MDNITTPPPKVSAQFPSFNFILEIAFSLIATASFMFNFMFCAVLLKKRSILRKPHNILIFSLAVVDMFTGVFLVATPGYVISKSSYSVPRGINGQVFCRLFGNRYLLFMMGKVSTLLVTCLAIERWYCVLRPIKYKQQFYPKRLLTYIAAMFVVTSLLSINKFFETSLAGKNCTSQKAPYGKHGTTAFIMAYSFVTFYIPFLITWLSFAHIAVCLPSSPGENSANPQQIRRQRLLLRTCATTAGALTVCVFPSQTIYILSPFDITQIGSPLHRGFNVLAFFNSCINPFIYWITNKEYRKEFGKLLGCKREISPDETDFGTQTVMEHYIKGDGFILTD